MGWIKSLVFGFALVSPVFAASADDESILTHLSVQPTREAASNYLDLRFGPYTNRRGKPISYRALNRFLLRAPREALMEFNSEPLFELLIRADLHTLAELRGQWEENRLSTVDHSDLMWLGHLMSAELYRIADRSRYHSGGIHGFPVGSISGAMLALISLALYNETHLFDPIKGNSALDPVQSFENASLVMSFMGLVGFVIGRVVTVSHNALINHHSKRQLEEIQTFISRNRLDGVRKREAWQFLKSSWVKARLNKAPRSIKALFCELALL